MPDEPGARRSPRIEAWKYGWWVLAGTFVGIGIAGALTVGVLCIGAGAVLVIGGVATSALRNGSAWGMAVGLAVAPLYVAWLNRDGPGRVCSSGAGGTSCVEQWTPWPFVSVAVVLALGGVHLARRSRQWTR